MQKETKQSFEELKEDYFKYSRLSMGSWRLSKDAFEKQLHSEQITILNDFGKLEKKHLIDHLTYDYRGQPNILKEEKEKLEKYSKEE